MIKLCNLNASDEAKALVKFLYEIEGKKVILGQHTLTRKQEELEHIQQVTGKLPALCGFELLSYSGNIDWDKCDKEALDELYANLGTIENALCWGRRGGIITMTWHWYSPVGGIGKSFFTRNTDFDPKAALIEGTPEHRAMLRDLNLMAVQLKRFKDEKLPILWRPFHESEGTWFWWSSAGPDTARALYRFMFSYFTEVHHLDNLIWVWNSPLKEGYVGDVFADILTRDLYPPEHQHTSLSEEYRELTGLSTEKQLFAIAEIGTQPDVDSIVADNIPWLWFMNWACEFALTEKYTSNEQMRKNYDSEYGLTLDRLPWVKL